MFIMLNLEGPKSMKRKTNYVFIIQREVRVSCFFMFPSSLFSCACESTCTESMDNWISPQYSAPSFSH